MKIITNDRELRMYIPNVLATVEGEMSLYDKMAPSLRAAEAWFSMRVTDLDDLYRQDGDIRESRFPAPTNVVPPIIVSDALYRCIDALNVVLTPNGFGIVSNDHVAPASKDRISALKNSLLEDRDEYIRTFLYEIEQYDWTMCDGWKKFHRTLIAFQDPTTGIKRFEDWEQAQGIYEQIEEGISNKFIGRELYTVLRSTANHENGHLAFLRRHLAAIEVMIDHGEVQNCTLAQMVNYIKQAKDADGKPAQCFDCWRESSVAELWKDHTFQNDPKKGGVWL